MKEVVHFYIMAGQSGLQWWTQLQRRLHYQRARRLLKKHHAILEQGITIHTEVSHCYVCGIELAGYVVARLRLKIRLPDDTIVATHTSTLVSQPLLPRDGQRVQIKFLPGDLSQVVLYN